MPLPDLETNVNKLVTLLDEFINTIQKGHDTLTQMILDSTTEEPDTKDDTPVCSNCIPTKPVKVEPEDPVKLVCDWYTSPNETLRTYSRTVFYKFKKAHETTLGFDAFAFKSALKNGTYPTLPNH